MRRLAIGLVFTLLIGTPAFAGTDQDTFSKLIGKVVAPTKGFKPRVACACVSGGAPGYLIQVSSQLGAQIVCVVPSFDADGAFAGTEGCPGNAYQVLGR